jgi:glycosyltransferase involved in cell wall biosynthesis
VLNQTFGEFELLIVNDGSTDGTVEIIKSFHDDRIVLIDQEQQGVAAALNNGLQHARATFIARFDADDICLPERLEKQYQFMSANPEYIVTGSGAEYIDNKGNYIFTYHPMVRSNEEIQKLAENFCPFIHASVMYRRDVVKTIGYNIHAHSFEDHMLWLNLRDEGKMMNFTEPLLSVRLNPGSLTMDERKRTRAFRRIKNRALKQKFIDRQDGDRMKSIIINQNKSKKKEGAYYSLLAKKFLWNNYDPVKARLNMKKAIGLYAFDMKDYLLLCISYLPKKIVNHLYALTVRIR